MIVSHVAIVGGGFSGALQAINLLRHEGPRATLIERRGEAGRGIAYSAAHPDHLLNVRAGNMSALPDDPDHFARWLERRHPDLSGGFAPRLVYGDYLAELLADARAADPDRLTIVHDEVCDIVRHDDRAALHLASGAELVADSVILAPGNLPPHVPAGIDPATLPEGCFVEEPWRGDLAHGLASDDTVLIVGSGLTMIDVALLLDARGFRGRMLAVSRRGLLPRPHAVTTPTTLPVRPTPEAVALLRHVRQRSREVGWRSAVDELRPHTEGLWRAAELPERQRFLRHLRAWWDVHRHRIAPEVAARIGRLEAEDRLTHLAARLIDTLPAGDGAVVRYRLRGSDRIETAHVRRIVNATGPQGDVRRSHEPLLRRLLARGLIRPDPLSIGIDVTPQSQVIDRNGAAQDWLLALGPMTRGTFWEIVAVPDIRRQTWSVARHLANAHWVGGEGL